MMSFRSFWGWSFALVCSILITVSLFGLMPGLIQRIPDRPDTIDSIKQIRVIRVKKPEPPTRKKEPEKIKKPKPVKKTAGSHIKPSKPRPVNLKPRLAFQLSSKLPALPMDPVMPDLEHFSMDVPVIKNQYQMGELDSPLFSLVKTPPIYPARAIRHGIEGAVTVQFLVTKHGGVEQIRIIEAQPKKIFDKSVIHCVSQWKFKPGTVEGIPVTTLAQTTVRFKLEK